MREFQVKCIQIAGIGKLVFNYNQKVKGNQLTDEQTATYLAQGAIVETEASKKALAKKYAEDEKANLEAEKIRKEAAKEAAIEELKKTDLGEGTTHPFLKKMVADLDLKPKGWSTICLLKSVKEFKDTLTDG